ncbi:MAG: signal peptidase I [Anaerolineales bacterium]|nr:signal peptidase I [Anaerolineales bacterium]
METVEHDANVENNQAAQEVQEKVNWGRFAFDIVETLFLAVILFVGINAISARVRVDGFSMRPTLEDGEFVLVNKMSYRFSEVSRGDIIVFHFPLNPEEDLVKRVIGLPGDHVLVQNNQVFVNGQLLNEPYISQPPLYYGEWMVTDGKLFVLGDNRNNSNDSKDWGLLPREKVVGKAILIYWPPPMWDVLEHTEVFAAQ